MLSLRSEFLDFGFELQESFDFEIFDFTIPLEALNLSGLLVALKHNVPADDDDQQPEDPVEIAREFPDCRRRSKVVCWPIMAHSSGTDI